MAANNSAAEIHLSAKFIISSKSCLLLSLEIKGTNNSKWLAMLGSVNICGEATGQ